MSKVSIVTISFNQSEFLERAIRSVLEQDYPNLEYIVVDPGSTDGSREIIDRYRSRIAKIVLEPDSGPADGLNKGFAHTTGDILGFLNSDDILFPGAITSAVSFLKSKDVDVVSGHATVIDSADRQLRTAYSDPFHLKMVAYGACVLVQPSTFFRRSAFERAGGFNIDCKASWDGQLWVDMALAGARFARTNQIWSGYRLHSESITSSGRFSKHQREDLLRVFRGIVGREWGKIDWLIAETYRFCKHVSGPRALYERLIRGPIAGRTG